MEGVATPGRRPRCEVWTLFQAEQRAVVLSFEEMQSAQSTVDYYFLEGLFLKNPPEKYSCPICLSSVQREAFLTQCCGTHFCLQCISRMVNASKPCPMCKASPLAVFPNKERQREINSLQVRCPTQLGNNLGNGKLLMCGSTPN